MNLASAARHIYTIIGQQVTRTDLQEESKILNTSKDEIELYKTNSFEKIKTIIIKS